MAACAWPDVCGAGLRALAALEPAEGSTCSSCELIADGVDAKGPHARLINFLDAGAGVRASLLLFLLPTDQAHHTEAAAALHSFLFAGSQTPPTVVPVAAIRFSPSVRDNSGLVRAIALNGAPSHKRPGIPEDAPLQDGVLAGMIHICRASGTPTLALLAQGFARQPEEDVQDVARALAAATCGVLDCGFSSHAIATWSAPRESGGDADEATLLYV